MEARVFFITLSALPGNYKRLLSLLENIKKKKILFSSVKDANEAGQQLHLHAYHAFHSCKNKASFFNTPIYPKCISEK